MFSLAGSPLLYTLSTEDIKIKHEVEKSLKQFWRSNAETGTDSHLGCMHSQPPPVLAQVPVANWPVINHIYCELCDQLREPGPFCSVSGSVVNFLCPSTKYLTPQKNIKGRYVRQWLVLLWKIMLVAREGAEWE